MSPFVSYVFPVHAAGVPLLVRSLTTLSQQTAPIDDYEAVVAVDAPDDQLEEVIGELIAAIPHSMRVPVTFVSSPRTDGNEHLPHRNHARNRGCQQARGEYLWVLDCDMLVDPCATEHLRHCVEQSQMPAVFSPCFAEPALDPEQWRACTSDFWQLKLRKKTASGRLLKYRRGSSRSMRVTDLPEGFPAFPRWLWEALGGYDERFLGWGGNKIEFCRRLRLLDALEGLIEFRLLNSTLFLHQPHERDDCYRNQELRASNEAMFRAVFDGAQRHEPWWLEQVARVRAAMGTQ